MVERRDRHLEERRAGPGLDPGQHRGDVLLPGDAGGVGDPEAAGHRDQVGTQAGVAALHAGLAVVPVVEHDHGQVGRLPGPDRAQGADAHQLLAVAGDHHDRALRLRDRDPQADRDGRAHGPPQVEVEVPVPGREQVVRRRTQPGHEDRVRGAGHQVGDELSAIDRCDGVGHPAHSSSHFLRPIRLWPSSTAA